MILSCRSIRAGLGILFNSCSVPGPRGDLDVMMLSATLTRQVTLQFTRRHEQTRAEWIDDATTPELALSAIIAALIKQHSFL
jgi:hypothetical protein